MRAHIDEYYTKEPQLYTLTPREEAVLARRRQSERQTPPASPGMLGRRRTSERYLPGSPGPRRLESEHTAHSRMGAHVRKTSRNGPKGYRAVPGSGESRSANSSPVARRRSTLHASPAANRRRINMRQQNSIDDEPREVVSRRRPPNLCYTRQFRRLGDLSEQEQRSVVALICNKEPETCVPPPGHTFTVTAHVCEVASNQVSQLVH